MSWICDQVPHCLHISLSRCPTLYMYSGVPLFTGCICIQVFHCLHAVSVFRCPTVYMCSGIPLFTGCICVQVSHCLHEILDLCSTFCRLLTFQLSMSPKADRDVTQLSAITQVRSSGSFISLWIRVASVWSGKPIHASPCPLEVFSML